MTRTFAFTLGATALWLAASMVPVHAADDAAPTPQKSPVHERGSETGTYEQEPKTGLPEVGVGRAMGAAKSSGDEGGTAAGMPGKGADNR